MVRRFGAVQRRDFEIRSQRGLWETDVDLADEIVAMALEGIVGSDDDLDPQVATGGAGVAGLALVADLDDHPGINARPNVDRLLDRFGNPSAAPAARAGVRNPGAIATAGRAGRRDLKETA